MEDLVVPEDERPFFEEIRRLGFGWLIYRDCVVINRNRLRCDPCLRPTQKLWFYYIPVVSIPNSIIMLKNLQELCVGCMNHLNSFCDTLESLILLKKISLHELPNFKKFPDNFKFPPNIEQISILRSGLETLPSFENLDKLRKLRIDVMESNDPVLNFSRTHPNLNAIICIRAKELPKRFREYTPDDKDIVAESEESECCVCYYHESRKDLEHPWNCECIHRLCSTCLAKTLNSKNPACPFCRNKNIKFS